MGKSLRMKEGKRDVGKNEFKIIYNYVSAGNWENCEKVSIQVTKPLG
jgi:hypothetical protein